MRVAENRTVVLPRGRYIVVVITPIIIIIIIETTWARKISRSAG